MSPARWGHPGGCPPAGPASNVVSGKVEKIRENKELQRVDILFRKCEKHARLVISFSEAIFDKKTPILSGLAEIYTMHSFAAFSRLNFLISTSLE